MDNIEESEEKKSTRPKLILIIGILVICVGVIFFLWWVNYREQVSKNPVGTNIPIEESTSTPPTAVELQQNFRTSVTALIGDIPQISAQNVSDLVSKVEDRLETIRVPSDHKEKYLNIFLAIENLKKDETSSVDTLKTKILELITPLTQSP